MPKLIDLTGKRFGRLTVIRRVDNYVPPDDKYNFQPQWECVCDCGTTGVITYGNHLKQGKTKSCGCLRRETAAVTGKKTRKKKEETE